MVLLAAGSGRRAGGKTPKQFVDLNGEPLFMASVRTFASVSSVNEIVVVAQQSYHSRIERHLAKLKLRADWKIVEGGEYRGASVRNGVLMVDCDPDVVLVHDTARALISDDIVRRVEKAAFKHGAALAAWPLPDTLKLASEKGRVRKTIPRKNLWLAQTPQAFRWNIAKACLLSPSETATDDAELAERKGFAVHVVEGAVSNFKVTYPTDLQLCRLLAK